MMRVEKDGRLGTAGDTVEARLPRHDGYEPPRVVTSRRLTEVTGQGAVVPSGAPVPRPPVPD